MGRWDEIRNKMPRESSGARRRGPAGGESKSRGERVARPGRRVVLPARSRRPAPAPPTRGEPLPEHAAAVARAQNARGPSGTHPRAGPAPPTGPVSPGADADPGRAGWCGPCFARVAMELRQCRRRPAGRPSLGKASAARTVTRLSGTLGRMRDTCALLPA